MSSEKEKIRIKESEGRIAIERVAKIILQDNQRRGAGDSYESARREAQAIAERTEKKRS